MFQVVYYMSLFISVVMLILGSVRILVLIDASELDHSTQRILLSAIAWGILALAIR